MPGLTTALIEQSPSFQIRALVLPVGKGGVSRRGFLCDAIWRLTDESDHGW